MSLVDRAQAITFRSQTEWPIIAAEPATPASIVTGYIAPLAAIGPVASAIGLALIGIGVPLLGTYREPIVTAIVHAVVTYVLILVGIGIISAIASALAPNFGGRSDTTAAIKLVGYSYTPAFITGILGLLPSLAGLEIIGGLWTLYLFYTGAPVLMLCTKEKALPYTATCVVIGIVLGVVVGAIIGSIGFATGAYGAIR